jgi:diacylglycerol kinase family enzyme
MKDGTGSQAASARRCFIIFNERAGTASATRIERSALEEQLASAGGTIGRLGDPRAPLDEQIEAALASECDVVVAAGGDGTVTAVADAIIGTNKTLGIVPLGTVNRLAKDLRIPLAVDKAVTTLATEKEQFIDAAEVNGRIFLHNVTVGMVPRIALERERIRGVPGLSEKAKFVRYCIERLSLGKRLAIEVNPSDAPIRIHRARAVIVANNPFDEGFGRVLSRERIDRGELAIYVVRQLGIGDLLRLASEMVAGRWQHDAALAVESARAVTVRLKREEVLVTLDGEVERLRVPLKFRVLPSALRVIAPMPEMPSPQSGST